MPDKPENKEMLYGKIAIMALLDLARVDKRLSPQSVITLQALGSRVGSQTQSYITANSIAHEMGKSHTAINNHINRLLEYGYITRIKCQKRGYSNKYIYHFNIKRALKYKNRIVEYRIVTEKRRLIETPNGFTGKKPSIVSKDETIGSFTMKDIEIKKKKGAKRGFVELGSVTQDVIGKALKRGGF